MKTIKLIKLDIENFQGGTYSLEADGEDTDIFAAMGVGKTREFSADQWLWFGKDSQGRSQFPIKNIDDKGEIEHELDHIVEGTYTIDEYVDEKLAKHRDITLKKIFREKWIRPRGKAEKKRTGNTTEHFINDAPVSESIYKNQLNSITGNEEIYKLLTSPTAFAALPWEERRKILFKIRGLTDKDILDTDEKLKSLHDIFQQYDSFSDPLKAYKKELKARQSKIEPYLSKKDKSGIIEVRIDEVSRALPDVAGLHKDALSSKCIMLESQLNNKKLELQGIDTGGRIAELSKALAVLNADIQRIEQDHHRDTMKQVNALNERIDGLERQMKAKKNRIAEIEASVESKKRQYDKSEQDRRQTLEMHKRIESEVFADTTEQKCAACGQDLPAARVNEARDKAQAAFNNDKASRLKTIERRGDALAEEKETIVQDIEKLNEERQDIENLESSDDLQSLVEDRDFKRITASEYDVIPIHKELSLKKSEIVAEINAEKEGRAVDVEKIKTKIQALNINLNDAKADADKFTQREKGEARIKELLAEEKKLAAESEEIESKLFLVEQFTRTKVKVLSEEINNLFEVTKFKLFNTLENGEIEECCDITFQWRPPSHGQGIQCGLDICRTLQRYHKIHAPIWIDMRESCRLIPKMECQLISLYHSPEDPVMRVEKAREGVGV